MLDFKEPELTDKPWIDEIIARKTRCADLCFTSIYLWKDSLGTRIARFGDRLIMKTSVHGRDIYTFPVGRGELKPAVDAIREDAAENGSKLVMRGICQAQIEAMRELYGEEFEAEADVDSFDYVYLASSLANPSGKRLHSKKNHINRFIAENDWSYEPIGADNLDDCRLVTANWLENNGSKLEENVLDESAALRRLFEDYFALGLEGGILRSGGRAVAFTVGEILSDDMFVTHFEKADADINGAYQMINREFARQITDTHPEILYINREEDMGIENLRRAKQSYFPEFMVEKYKAKWR